MNVLVTGAAGFLGAHLANRLGADGHLVVGVDNMLGGEMDNLDLNVVRFYCADCCSQETMSALMGSYHIELVYHCAASPHEGLSVFSPAVVTRNTYLSTAAVASAACARGVRRFVFTSSMSRYGHGWLRRVGYDFRPFNEDTLPRPVDPYGIAKVASEDVLEILGREHGLEVVVAVPHNIYGPLQRYVDPMRNVAAIMTNRMLSGQQPFIYGDGTQMRCFSYIDDCIGPLLDMGTKPNVVGEVVNIGPDEGAITINQLAVHLAEIIGFNLSPIYLDPRPCEVHTAWPSSAKARSLLGYEAKTGIVEGLRLLVEWIRKRGPRPFEYTLPVEIVTEKTPRPWVERLM